MPQPIPTTITKILLNLQAKAVAFMGFPIERVNVYGGTGDDPPSYQGDQYLVIWAQDGRQLMQYGDGAGRLDTRFERRVSIKLRTRLMVDVPYDDTAWATDPNLGHLDTEHMLFDCFECYQVTDAQQNWLVDRPMRCKSVTGGQKDRKGPGWGESTVSADVTYILDLNQAYQ